jgi:iron complex transport system permease protein
MKPQKLGFALVILSVLSLFLGAKSISLQDLWNRGEMEILVLLMSRIPRLLSVIITGMALSISGLIMQQVTRNRFVSPTTAATMDSAKFGILLVMLFLPGAPMMGKMAVAFLFALAGTFLFMMILRRVKVKNVIVIPLVGIMLGNLIDAVTTFVAYRFDLVQNVNSWLQGSFSLITKGRYEILYITIPLVVLAYFFAHQFTIAGMGEDFAKNLGLRYELIVNLGLGIVALISSAILVTVGNIPFVGLIIPNVVAMIFGDHLRKNLSTTLLLGAIFLLLCDILGRWVIYPYEISISLTVGVLGGLIFLYLLLKGGDTP